MSPTNQRGILTNYVKTSLFLIFLQIIASTRASVEITTKLGAISGIRGKTLHGKEIHQFLGIPYAEPPIGPLRLFSFSYFHLQNML